MKLQFFLPEILNMPTGGNVYNYHLMRELQRHHDVTPVVIPSGKKFDETFTGTIAADAVWVIDSLLISHSGLMEKLKAGKSSSKKWLLVHYLNLLDPRKVSDPESKKERQLLQNFDGFIVTSQFSKSQLENEGVSTEKITVIRPGVQERTWIKRKPRLLVQILTVSSIFPGKGLTEFLEILESLSDLPWQWILAGENKLHPEYSAEFLGQVNHCRLKNRIQVLGPISQLSLFQLYKQSDIFTLNSRFESCSMVTMEAMCFGLPVLANKVGGLSELVKSDENGFLAPLEDTDQFTYLLRKLISDAGLRISLGEKAFHNSRNFPGWQESAENFSSFIRVHTKS